MEIENELYNLLQSLNNSLNNLLKDSYLSSTDSKLERFLYILEKRDLKSMNKLDF